MLRTFAAMALLGLVACNKASDVVTAPYTPATPTGTVSTPTGSTTTPTGTATGSTTTTPTTTPNQVGVSDPPDLPQGTLDAIGSDIDGILGRCGYTNGVFVVDLENGQEIYAENPDLPLKPASNTKLFTTAVAMDQLGADHRFQVSAWSPSQPNGSGAITDLDIVVEHDFTWSNFFYADEFFAMDRLADQLYEAGVRSVSGTLTVHGEVVVDGYQFAYYDAALHRDAALDVLTVALADAGISHTGGYAAASGFTPGGVLLTSRLSPPLSVAAHPLNVYSHNEFADILARHNGYELWGGSSYADGEAAALDWLAGYGIDTSDIAFNDGSGLSHDNRVTARSVVEMIQAMDRSPEGEDWVRTFSIAGEIGTLSGRMTGSDTLGLFVGKTGTLNGVIATSGILYHRYDGHRYGISVLMNDTNRYDNSGTRSCQNQVIEAVASDRRGGGARPSAPILEMAWNDGGTVHLTWESSTNADRYTVWVSTDGVWRRSEARSTTATSIDLTGLPRNRNHWFRVTAVGPGGLSAPSDTYSVRVAAAPSRVLVVDGNDRWDWQWENNLGTGHRLAATTALALGARTHDTVANEAVIDGLVSLTDYDAVVWVLGEESTDDLSFDADERALVDAYLAAGGNLLVSGAEIGWDLDNLGDVDMQGFYTTSLHASYVADSAGTSTVLPAAGGLFDGIEELGFYTPGTLEVNFPDVISPVGGARTELSYVGGSGGTAALSYSGAYKVVHLGFPFETIDNAPQREQVMDRVMGFFGIP